MSRGWLWSCRAVPGLQKELKGWWMCDTAAPRHTSPGAAATLGDTGWAVPNPDLNPTSKTSSCSRTAVMNWNAASVRRTQVFITLLWTKLVLFQLEQGLNFCVKADVILVPELGLGRN